MYRKNTAGQVIYFSLVNASTGAALTGATVTAYRALDSTAQAAATGTTTELGNGQYRFALSQADTNGDYGSYLFTATNAVPVEKTVVFTGANPTDGVRFGLTALPNAAAGANGGLPTGDASGRVTVGSNADKTGYSLTQSFPSNFSSLAITVGGAVTAGTVSDKTGYSLTQTFPSNFSSLAITAGGAVTAGTVSDKTGYSLSQSFPSNFSALSIDVSGKVLLQATQTGVTIPTVTTLTNAPSDSSGVTTLLTRLPSAISLIAGAVTVGTNNDKTGYSLTQTFPTNFSSLAITVGGAVTAGTVSDKTGYSLTSAPPTATAIADALLGRNLAGGSDGGRTVKDALRAARNKVAFDVPAVGQFTVYAEDDTTPAWTGTYSRGAAGTGPLVTTDPS